MSVKSCTTASLRERKSAKTHLSNWTGQLGLAPCNCKGYGYSAADISAPLLQAVGAAVATGRHSGGCRCCCWGRLS